MTGMHDNAVNSGYITYNYPLCPHVCPVRAFVNKKRGYFAQCWCPPEHSKVADMKVILIARDLTIGCSIDAAKHINSI